MFFILFQTSAVVSNLHGVLTLHQVRVTLEKGCKQFLMSRRLGEPKWHKSDFSSHLHRNLKPGGVGLALRTPKPQVRGSVFELGKVDSIFHPFSGSNKLRTKHTWELNTGG